MAPGSNAAAVIATTPRAGPPLEPSATLEVDEQREQTDQLGTDAENKEGFPAADVADEPAEVLAEEACDPGERQKDGGDDRQLFHDAVQPVGDGGEVDVHR